ncbi:hypothetical protein IWW54_001561 [Coemansia sp. RSA 2705]|nr:hypothetical protein IWW54_001561 [Coemansia sp. RSA 2705]
MTYADLSMIVEAKGSTREQKIAYRQMFRYSRPIYQFQPDRRYLWGLTVCDTDVRVLLFAPTRTYSSVVFDFVTTGERKSLADLFVHWSLCTWDQYGYDSTTIFKKTQKSPNNRPGGLGSRRRVSGQSGSTVATIDAPANSKKASPTQPPKRAQPDPMTRTSCLCLAH